MKSQEDEIRRLQRLREQQLKSRDPTAKQTKQYQRTVSRYRSHQKKMTMKSIINDLPAKFWYMVIGTLLGVVIALALNIFFPQPWVRMVSWVFVLFGLVGGRLVGAARDWGDEDWVKRSK